MRQIRSLTIHISIHFFFSVEGRDETVVEQWSGTDKEARMGWGAKKG
jgi:hypothetical protein